MLEPLHAAAPRRDIRANLLLLSPYTFFVINKYCFRNIFEPGGRAPPSAWEAASRIRRRLRGTASAPAPASAPPPAPAKDYKNRIVSDRVSDSKSEEKQEVLLAGSILNTPYKTKLFVMN